MKSQNEKINAKKQDEATTNRILIVFSLSLLLLLVVMFISRFVNSFAYYGAVTFCSFGAAIFGAAGAGLMAAAFVIRQKKHGLWFGRLMLLGGTSLVMAAMLLFIRLYTFRAFGILYAAIPIAAFLYMIYSIYQRDFFFQSIVAGCTAVTLYLFSRWLHHRPWHLVVHATYIVAIALLVAAVPVLLAARKNNGKVLNKKFLPLNANYNMIFLTLGLMLLSIVTVLAAGSGIAFWMMVGVLGYLFVLAVYYTIKLM